MGCCEWPSGASRVCFTVSVQLGAQTPCCTLPRHQLIEPPCCTLLQHRYTYPDSQHCSCQSRVGCSSLLRTSIAGQNPAQCVEIMNRLPHQQSHQHMCVCSDCCQWEQAESGLLYDHCSLAKMCCLPIDNESLACLCVCHHPHGVGHTSSCTGTTPYTKYDRTGEPWFSPGNVQ